jgi:hypothetical protein
MKKILFYTFALLLFSRLAFAQTVELKFVPFYMDNDSVVIKAQMKPTGGNYRFDGVSVSITYDPGKFYIDPLTTIHEKYFSRYGWDDNSVPDFDMNGSKPDIIMYEEDVGLTPGIDRLIGQNQIIPLCMFTFLNSAHDSGTTDFNVHANFDAGAYTYYTVTTDALTHKFVPALVLTNFWYPVELNSFTAAQQGRGIALSWTTVSERDNKGFDIERRALEGSDNLDWIKIGSANGSGTTTQEHQYLFFDNLLPRDGTYEYRLIQKDFDGRETELRSVRVEYRNSSLRFALHNSYPNPVSLSSGTPATITYDIAERSRVKLIATNLIGQQVAEFTNDVLNAGSYTASWLPADLPTGAYLVILTAEGELSGKTQRASIHLNIMK